MLKVSSGSINTRKDVQFIQLLKIWRRSGVSIVFPANIYLFKVNNTNTRKRCEICSELRIKQ